MRHRAATSVVAGLVVFGGTTLATTQAFAANPHPTATAELTWHTDCSLHANVSWANFTDSVTTAAAQLMSRSGGRPTQLQDRSVTATGTLGTTTIDFTVAGTPGDTYYVTSTVFNADQHVTAKSKAITVGECTQPPQP